jgi:putative endonuclease
MLICEDGSYYIGSTNNLAKRFANHVKGKGGSYTRSHHPVKVVYSEELVDKSSALKREHALKKLSRAQKSTLIVTHT